MSLGISTLSKYRIPVQLTFWGIAVWVLLKNFQTSSAIGLTDVIFTIIFSMFLAVAVYVELLLLIPRLLQKGKYLFFIIASILLAILGTWLLINLFDPIVETLFPGYYLISYFDFLSTLKYFIIFLTLTSLLHLSTSWFQLKASENKLLQLEQEHLKAELDALKGQLNPHFLFNSLNSIYALVLKQAETAPDALLKLSGALRYVIYEANADKVSIDKELAFLEDYIALQKLRVTNAHQLDITIERDEAALDIAPLLLVTILENCFKYGLQEHADMANISIQLLIQNGVLTLRTKNGVFEQDSPETAASGVGLKNLIKRLELIYPDSHHLHISEVSNIFAVELVIEL